MIISGGSVLGTQLETIGDRTPIFSDASYYPQSAIQLASSWAAYGAIYKEQLWVTVLVNKLAKATARLPLDAKLRSDEDNNNESTPLSPELAALLERPNPHMDGYRLKSWTSSTRSVYGEAFWLKVRDDKGRVRELYPVHPANMILRRDPDTGDLKWVYSNGTRQGSLSVWDYEDVVPFFGYNPDTTSRGFSVLEPLRQTLLNEDASRQAQTGFWANGARPGVILTHPESLPFAATERIKRQWQDYAGAQNTGKTVVLDEGIKPTVVQLNSEELQYIQSRKLNREEVCAAFDVPPPVVHILDNATYSNITEQMRSMYRDTMAPILGEIEAAINHHLVPDFDQTGKGFVRFNMDEVLRGDFETRATAVVSLVTNGIAKPSEARVMFNLPPVGPDADKLYANGALVPLGSPTERVSITAAAPATSDQAGEAASVADDAQQVANDSPTKRLTVRAIRGRVGMKTSAEAKRAALIDEHEKAIKSFFDRQATAVTKAFAPRDWDNELADLLQTLGEATAQTIGQQIAKDLGGSYSLKDLSAWLEEESLSSAGAINQVTANQIQSVIDATEEDNSDPEKEPVAPEVAVAGFFSSQMLARAAQIAITRVSVVGGFSTLDAAKQNNGTHKTWRLGSGKPRPSHAKMSGETVPVGEPFSNGMLYPGDTSAGPDENAGCTCTLTIGKGDK